MTIENDPNPTRNKPRRESRFPVDTRIIVNRGGPSVSGQAIEISQSGIAILAAADLALDEVVELHFELRQNRMHLRAVVRNRSGARYGLEFLTLSAEQRKHIISVCHT